MKKYFSQNDLRWKNKLLGFSNLKLQNYGCFVIALANLSGIEPDEVNKILKKEKCFDGADIISSKRMANSLGLSYSGMGDKHFGVKCRTIAEVDASERAGIQKHFVVVKEDGSIIDSWDGKIKPKGTYPIINYRLFRKKEQEKEEDLDWQDKVCDWLREHIYNFGNKINEKEEKEIIKRLSAYKNGALSDEKYKQVQLSLRKYKDALSEYIAKNKGLQEVIETHEETIKDLENVNTKNIREIKIGQAFVFLLNVIKNKLK